MADLPFIAADDNSADKSDSLLYQMQVLFSNLMKSVKRYYDTIEFCAAYKVRFLCFPSPRHSVPCSLTAAHLVLCTCRTMTASL